MFPQHCSNHEFVPYPLWTLPCFSFTHHRKYQKFGLPVSNFALPKWHTNTLGYACAFYAPASPPPKYNVLAKGALIINMPKRYEVTVQPRPDQLRRQRVWYCRLWSQTPIRDPAGHVQKHDHSIWCSQLQYSDWVVSSFKKLLRKKALSLSPEVHHFL